jgi:transcriptional regulator with XRE-family HTH domain
MKLDRQIGNGAALGERLRRMRRERGWTLADVSSRTGLAVSTLSKVENNRISLTYNNLAKLASGLEVDLANFFTSAAVQDTFGRRVVCRRGEGQLHETTNFAHEYLVAELLHRRMVPICSHVKARSFEEFGELDRHLGEELVYVLEGTIELYVEPDEPLRLRAGDCCYFDARAGHAAISVGRSEALILSVVSAPLVHAAGPDASAARDDNETPSPSVPGDADQAARRPSRRS